MRLPPDVFWKLSLPEWHALVGLDSVPTLARRDLETLMQRYPDGQ